MKLFDILNKNRFLIAILTLFVTMYGPKFAPKLPPYLFNLLNNWFLKGLIMFLIIYYSNKNIIVSLTVTIVFFTLNMISKKYLILENFIKYTPASSCNNNKEKLQKYLNQKSC